MEARHTTAQEMGEAPVPGLVLAATLLFLVTVAALGGYLVGQLS